MLGLDALPGDEARECRPVDPQHAPDADGLEAAVVDQPAHRLRVHAEAVGDLPHAVETCGVDVEHTINVAQVCGPCMGRMAYSSCCSDQASTQLVPPDLLLLKL